jgi:hypothetical protein
LFVNASGDIQIGSSCAGVANGSGLEIERSTTSAIRLTGASGVSCEFFNTGTLASIQTRSTIPFTIQTNELERLRITDAGLVGIGTSAPVNSLQVTSPALASVPSAGSSGHFLAVGSSPYGIAGGALTNGNSYLQVTRWDGTATNYNLLLQPNGGNVGIGTTSPGDFNQVVNAPHLVVGGGTTSSPGLTLYSTTSGTPIIAFADGTAGNQQYRGYLQYDHTNDALISSASSYSDLILPAVKECVWIAPRGF